MTSPTDLSATVAAMKKTLDDTVADNKEMKADLNAFYLMWAGARVVAASRRRKEQMVLSPPSARAAQVR